jgi:hypothetical protein
MAKEERFGKMQVTETGADEVAAGAAVAGSTVAGFAASQHGNPGVTSLGAIGSEIANPLKVGNSRIS